LVDVGEEADGREQHGQRGGSPTPSLRAMLPAKPAFRGAAQASPVFQGAGFASFHRDGAI
jgi:hypothetical protein